MANGTDWLEVKRGEAPLVVAFPHSGTDVPSDIAPAFVSLWQARRDADWWVNRLYGFAAQFGATTLRTALSRSVIDVNRDPSGRSLYPGQATTELCPTTDFDGAPLYREGLAPDAGEIARRTKLYFEPYHGALREELQRLSALHGRVVLFDAHSIRSRIPRLFEGELPQFNIGSNDGRSCDAALSAVVEQVCAKSGMSHVVNGRFKGGWTTRHYGKPEAGIHAIQLELACRGYIDEPETPTQENWPVPYSDERAAALVPQLKKILEACLVFTRNG